LRVIATSLRQLPYEPRRSPADRRAVQLDLNVDARRKFQASLSPCGDTNTVERSILMGNGTGPVTVARAS